MNQLRSLSIRPTILSKVGFCSSSALSFIVCLAEIGFELIDGCKLLVKGDKPFCCFLAEGCGRVGVV